MKKSLILFALTAVLTSFNARHFSPVWGVFEGRVPCKDMAREISVPVENSCELLKWRFTFHKNPHTGEIATYEIDGSLYRNQKRQGKCTIIKGTKELPSATVLKLETEDATQAIYLLKGDDNVLFVLNKNLELMHGDSYVSYTFNRISNSATK